MDFALLTGLLAWGVLTGIVFSAIGAAGGILTSFGLISLFGVAEPNAVKPMTQIVVLATALVFVPGYFARRAIVVPLGMLLGAGGLAGAWAGSTLSSLYLADMKSFRPLFGLLALAIGAQILWKLARERSSVPPSTRAPSPATAPARVCDHRFEAGAHHFAYGDAAFRIPLWHPLLAGFVIAMVAAIFGVGGGFLLVPYMASLLCLPMHIIPATAAIAIFMSLAVSIGNFIARGAPVDYALLAPLAAGAILGALLGPAINRRARNSWLQGGLALVVIGIGLKYVLS